MSGNDMAAFHLLHGLVGDQAFAFGLAGTGAVGLCLASVWIVAELSARRRRTNARVVRGEEG